MNAVVNISENESRSFYAPGTGLISLVVYEEQIEKPDAIDRNRDPHLLAMKNGILPKEPAKNKSVLGRNVTQKFFDSKTKGLFGSGGGTVEVNHVVKKFERALPPILSGTVRYYRPAKRN